MPRPRRRGPHEINDFVGCLLPDDLAPDSPDTTHHEVIRISVSETSDVIGTSVGSGSKPPSGKFGRETVAGVEKGGWLALVIGLLLAGVILAVPFLEYLLSHLSVLIHELGHAVFGWLFGYPSIPALDFTYGGGVTIHTDRAAAVTVAVCLGWAGLFGLWAWGHRIRIVALSAALALYGALALTDWHEVAILFMGHGTELVLAGVFLYRALSGSAVLHPLERPLYACVGGFILFDSLQFSHRLVTDEAARLEYESAKCGGHVMDFSRIAEEYLGVGLETVALVFLACCLAVPLLVLAAIWYRSGTGSPAESVR